jgi:hypothetical protein
LLSLAIFSAIVNALFTAKIGLLGRLGFLMCALAAVAFAIYCFRLTWLAFMGPDEPEPSKSNDENSDSAKCTTTPEEGGLTANDIHRDSMPKTQGPYEAGR